MKTIIMQSIDRYLGRMVCGMMSVFHRRHKQPPETLTHLVIIKMFGMGSIVLMSPMVRALKNRYPGVRISFVSLSENLRVPGMYDMTDHCYGIRRSSMFAFAFDTLRTILQLRSRHVSAVLDAEFFSRYTAVFSFLIRPRYHAGFYNRDIYRGNLIDYHAYFNPYRHMIDNFNELALSLSCACTDHRLEFPQLSEAVFDGCARALRSAGIEDTARLVLVNPNVSDTSPLIDRSWPLEHFAAFARDAISRGYTVGYIGSPSQKEHTAHAAGLAPGAVSLAGVLSLEELLACMSRSLLLLTNDSGPLHLAASVDLPTFAFFGTESPVIFGHSAGLHQTFYRGYACSPCLSVFNYKRGICEFGSRCMKDISVEKVIDRFHSLEEALKADQQSRTRKH
ncbi:MAG: hypothetical protein A2075_06200 [Geobacteraceae bacterium GWC2_58_44]|nr:MAG: hypothetical protein A2075_06200 [Geobacteraceae bacterium GWC2_58_44]